MNKQSTLGRWWNELVIRHPALYILEAIGRWALGIGSRTPRDGWDTRPLGQTLLWLVGTGALSAGCLASGCMLKGLAFSDVWQPSYLWTWLAPYLSHPQQPYLADYELAIWSLYFSCGYNVLVYLVVTRSLRHGATDFQRTLHALMLVGHGLFLICLPLELLFLLLGPDAPLGPTERRFGD
ncbi:MAG: hypothetical protein EOO60_12445 [Hymenobacter sp.]|nr:MAG: hypothetical protein EOO60_12445 [Hymenobacter sp.]